MTRFLLLLALVPLAWPPHAGAQVAGARTIEIQVGDNMRFTPARIDARPGEQLHVVLKDTGTMPKVAMATAMASSKLLEAAVKESVQVTG